MADEKTVAVRDENSLAALIERPEYKNRFHDVMGLRAPQFMSSVLSLQMHTMRDVEPKSIIAAAMTAASLDLPINPNLGFAYIIAYKDNNRGGVKYALFQIGYKGFVQLAMRTGQYRFMNATRIFEGELVKADKLTGELIINQEARKSDKIVGFASYFKLVNGFEHALYMSVEEVTKHGKRYSQSFKKGYGLWVDDFESMALKTVLKLNLSKWGVLSVQMERAMYEDQGMKRDIDAEVTYVDNADPIPAAQITDRTQAPAAPTEAAPAATETPTVETPVKEKKTPKKKGSLKLAAAPDEKKEKAPVPVAAATPAPSEEKPPGGPFAKKLVEKLNEAGLLLADFVAFAFYQKWLKAPDGYSDDIGDVDLSTVIMEEAQVDEFLETDNWLMIVEELQKQKKAKA